MRKETELAAVIDASFYVRPPNIAERFSAGGVIVRREAETGRVFVALAREGNFTSLVLPKGGIDNGETPEQAARREITEEAGFTDLTLLADLGTRGRLGFERTMWLTTHYFLFETREINVTPTDPAHPQGPVWRDLAGADKIPFMWPEQKQLVLDNRARILQIGKESNP